MNVPKITFHPSTILNPEEIDHYTENKKVHDKERRSYTTLKAWKISQGF